MRISELARRAGVTTKAVRYYESLGLLMPERLANGYRDYDEHDVRLTQEIRALGSLGIPVERTRRPRWLDTGTRSTSSRSGLMGSPPAGRCCSHTCRRPLTAIAASHRPTKERT